MTATTSRRTGLVAAAVFVVSLVAFLPWIGAQEIWSKDEARTALVVREMIDSGDWSLPRVPGGAHSRKPPLYHWMVALLARRSVDELALRLPAAVAAAAGVSVTFLIGAQLATPGVGLGAAAMLTATPIFFEWARVARMESLLVFCIALSVWGLGRWLLSGGRRNGLLFGLGVGLGVLTKGPAGLLPVLVAALTLLVFRPRPAPLRELWPGLALALALPLAWLVPAAFTADDFTEYAQYVGPTIARELSRPSTPVMGAVGGMAVGFFPWTVLLPGSLVLLARRRPLPLLVVISLVWLAVVLVVFLVVISPRAVYFLPACPALALIAAWAWLASDGSRRSWMAWPLGLAVAAALMAGFVTAVRRTTLTSHGDLFEVPRTVGLVCGSALLVFGLLALRSGRRGRPVTIVVLLALGTVVTLVTLDAGARVPFYNRLYPIRASARHLERHIPTGAEVGFTEAQRDTALAAQIARPLRQLPPVDADELQTPPPYVLLPERDFVTMRETWSLRPVDEVYLRNVRYILAATGPLNPPRRY